MKSRSLNEYPGIHKGKWDTYTKEELDILPPIPHYEKGKDYPEWCDEKDPPIYWIGWRWIILIDGEPW